jgi:hypothetical protein
MTRVKEEFKKILLQWKNKNKTRLWQENAHKIGVE